MTEDSSQWIAQQVPDGGDWLEYMVVKGNVSQETAGVFNHFSLGVQNIERSMNLLYEARPAERQASHRRRSAAMANGS